MSVSFSLARIPWPRGPEGCELSTYQSTVLLLPVDKEDLGYDKLQKLRNKQHIIYVLHEVLF
jgi:hypothetical protein